LERQEKLTLLLQRRLKEPALRFERAVELNKVLGDVPNCHVCGELFLSP
jgi:hypothetical protein